MPPKKRKKQNMFLKRDKLSMVAGFEAESYTDVYETCIERIRAEIHLQRPGYESRQKFVKAVCEDNSAFTRCMKVMIEKYLVFFKLYMKKNRFAQFEQAWFSHLEDYFTAEDSCCSMEWSTVVKNSKCE